jgi:hypothetical protein
MNCPYCNQPAKYGPNEYFYNGKRYGRSYMCYYCKPCGAYVGTHNNTTVPLGTMANQELRKWRKEAHNAFDRVWKNKRISRKEAYRWLSKTLGVKEIHIGESDIFTCKEIIKIMNSPIIEGII